MNARIAWSALLATSLLSFAAVAGLTQEKTKEVKKAPMSNTSASSGSEMYMSYCAACHGKDAKGDGPAASALKTAPANLTQLAKKNNGKFPTDHIANILRSGTTGAHGSSDMPVWGPLFSSVSGGSDAIVQLRIANLTRYLESIQEK